MQLFSYPSILVIKNPDNGISITINKSNVRFIKEFDMLSYEDILDKSINILGAYFELFDDTNTSFNNSEDAYNYLVNSIKDEDTDLVAIFNSQL